MRLADLDRDELLALAEKFCPAGGADLLKARVEAARKREALSYAAWKKAADLSIVDARAVKARIESKGFDIATTNMMAISKASTRTAGDFWRAYQEAYRRRVAVEREAERAGA